MKKLSSVVLISIVVCACACSCSWAQKNYAVVNTSVGFLRISPDYESSLESQAMMGTVVEVIDSERYWRKVNVPDYKNVWITEANLAFMTKSEIEVYSNSAKYICTADYSKIYEAPDYDSDIISDLILGDLLLKGDSSEGSWTEVRLPSGQIGYVFSSDLSDYAQWQNSRVANEETIVKTAKHFIGVPYMWGGNTVKHFDCSGLTKTVYSLCGITLPRNASQQIKKGRPIEYDFSKMRPGDLLFFGTKNDDGSIRSVTHVAIYIGDKCIIHSSMLVRINSLVKDGKAPYYDREPIAIRRIL